MKRLSLVFMIVGLLCYNASAFAELSVDDLEKIQQLIDKFEERIDKRFTDLEKRFTSEIQAQGKLISHQGERLNYLGSLMITLIVTIIGFVAVPMGLITYQYLKIRSQQDDEIKVLREKIQAFETQMLVEARSKMFKKEQKKQIQNE